MRDPRGRLAEDAGGVGSRGGLSSPGEDRSPGGVGSFGRIGSSSRIVSRRSCLPWLALLALGVCHVAAQSAAAPQGASQPEKGLAENPASDKGAGSSEVHADKTAGTPSSSSEKGEVSPDVEDTHQRMKRIYDELGISPENVRAHRGQGCSCWQPPHTQRKRRCRPRSAKPDTEGNGGQGSSGQSAGGFSAGGAAGSSAQEGDGQQESERKSRQGTAQDGRQGKAQKPKQGEKPRGQKEEEEVFCEPEELRPEPSSGLPPFVGYLLLGVVLVVMLVPLYFALRNSFQSGVTPAEEAPTPAAGPAAEAGPSPWIVNLEASRQLAQQGRLSEAFATLHRHLLLALEQNDVLALSPTTTNWEYVRQLKEQPVLQRVLRQVTQAAEQAVLGQDPPAAEHYWELEQLVSQNWGARS